MSDLADAKAVPPCPHSHEAWKLVSTHYANARISIPSCMHCGWVDTEDIIKQVNELAAAEGSHGWQPIATAPTEGERILGVIVGSRVRVTWWDSERSQWACFNIAPPTHWMPLPAPPSAPSASGE